VAGAARDFTAVRTDDFQQDGTSAELFPEAALNQTGEIPD
jgi:hypothetical protein